MRAVKGNRVYTIDESSKARYQNEGFDIFDDKGDIVAHGKGKTASYAEYDTVKKENESLKQQLAALKKGK